MNQPRSDERSRDRSPRYPAVSLETALNRAFSIYKLEGRHPVPQAVAAHHWHLSEKSSSFLTLLAAMRSHGLLDDSRTQKTSGKVILTDLGVRLVADEKAVNPDRPQLLKEAALKPTIYANLWEKYGGELPSDELLEYQLKTERGFTETAAKTFIRNFRSSLAYAGVSDGFRTEDPSIDSLGSFGGSTPVQRSSFTDFFSEPFRPKGIKTEGTTAEVGALDMVRIPILLPDSGRVVLIQIPASMTDDDWEHMIEVLRVNKRAYVRRVELQGNQTTDGR